MSLGEPPLILTAQLDGATFGWLDGQRQAYFPAERNHVPAHLTLFHALPGAEMRSVRAVLEDAARRTPRLAVDVTEVVPLGRGVAHRLRSAALERLRRDLSEAFDPWLTPQDAQGFRAHVTVQNKAAPENARRLLAELRAGFVPRHGTVEGLLLWRYLGGP